MIAYKKLTVPLILLTLLVVACSPKAWQAFVLGPEAVYLTPLETSKTDPCKQTINYAPSIEYPGHTPMRFIHTRFLIMQHAPNDPNTLQPEEAEAYVQRLLEIVNYKLSLNQKMNLPVGNETPVLPINYRFVVHIDTARPGDNGIDFAVDSTMSYFDIKSNTHGSYDGRAFNKYAAYKSKVLTVVIQEHHPDSIKSATYVAKSTGTGFPDWVKIVGPKQFLEKTIDAQGNLQVSGHRVSIFLHETGHSFGLPHTWGGDNCDDTPDHPNCWDSQSPKCPDGIVSNNMMDYNNRQDALTPCQLGIIHYNFGRLGSPQRKYLVPTWCQYKKNATISIFEPDVTWNNAKDLEGDIVIQNGGKLTIACRVSLPKGAKIIIKPKGTLVLDGAHITNLCEEQWQGIEIWGNEKGKGGLIIYRQPTIEHTVNPINLSNPAP